MLAHQSASAPRRLVLAAALIVVAAGVARADEGAPGPGVRFQWAGVELLPLSVNAGTPPYGLPSPARFRAGLGGMLRVVRLQWPRAYWTPVEAGAFFAGSGSGNDGIVLLQAATEGGVRLPVGGGTLELGVGAGVGGLSIAYAGSCDGTCVLGGVGPMLSPVARYLLPDTGRWSLGFVVRAAVPLSVPHEEWVGHIRGFGALFMGGIDVAFKGG